MNALNAACGCDLAISDSDLISSDQVDTFKATCEETNGTVPIGEPRMLCPSDVIKIQLSAKISLAFDTKSSLTINTDFLRFGW